MRTLSVGSASQVSYCAAGVFLTYVRIFTKIASKFRNPLPREGCHSLPHPASSRAPPMIAVLGLGVGDSDQRRRVAVAVVEEEEAVLGRGWGWRAG